MASAAGPLPPRAPGQALVLAGPDGEECAAALNAALAAAEGDAPVVLLNHRPDQSRFTFHVRGGWLQRKGIPL